MKMEECTVAAVFPERGTVRVKREQSDGILSAELPILFQWTLKNQEYTMPAIEEPVICIFNGSVGYVLGAIYNDVSTPPVKDVNKRYMRFEDGSFIEYDAKAHQLFVKIEGELNIETKGVVTVNGQTLTLNGSSSTD
ncbi:phage baseplate assembly protein V [Lysinibacillus irui]|uniref:phage baseplate assembly protein V n=1 Tax=Lysinibacillus irui TaxID=2998077 RepID=UPI002AD4E61C|nr:phage baseplate assembly protein V [Lysinibacillus irui]MEA0565539.1 phage baseplate assembly protein V [Lysinibacillus irui]